MIDAGIFIICIFSLLVGAISFLGIFEQQHLSRKKPIRNPLIVRIPSAEEIKFREQFAPIAKKCRKLLVYSKLVLLVWLSFWVFPSVLFVIAVGSIIPKLPSFIDITLGILLLVLIILSNKLWLILINALEMPKFECPACHKPLFAGKLVCCPKCGSKQLTDIIKGRYCYKLCETCGFAIPYFRKKVFKFRMFKIKACIHCGVLLDEKGF